MHIVYMRYVSIYEIMPYIEYMEMNEKCAMTFSMIIASGQA